MTWVNIINIATRPLTTPFNIYLVGIESVDDQTHQLRNLSLERKGLRLGRHCFLYIKKKIW